MMAASGKAGWDKLFPPVMPGFTQVPFGDAAAVAEKIHAGTVAVMVEPIQGEAGVIVPPPGYLQALREITERAGILLILDEVQTGIGRTGTMFAFEQHAITPDLVTLGKGLGGGVPISAVLASEPASCFAHGDQGGTYNGNPLMTAVANTVVNIVNTPEFLGTVIQRGEQLKVGLTQLVEQHGYLEVRGAGLLLAIKLQHDNAATIAQTCFDQGLLINAPRADTLRLMLSLRVSETEISSALVTLNAAMR